MVAEITLICDYCSESFTRKKRGRSLSAAKNFCCREHQRLGQTYVPGVAYSRAGVYSREHTCADCGASFVATHHAQLYCTETCRRRRTNKAVAKRYAETTRGHGYSKKDATKLKQALLLKTTHCRICKRDFELFNIGQIHLDHDHATGKIRGLLCFNCNAGLGHFKDSVARLRAAIEYLETEDEE